MEDRWVRVIDIVAFSDSCSEEMRKIINGIKKLDDELCYLDYNHFEDMMEDETGEELIDIVKRNLGLDISDMFETEADYEED